MPLHFWCSNWGSQNNPVPWALASSLGGKSSVCVCGLGLPSPGALWRRSREQISIVTVFPERSVDSWQPISFPFLGQGAVASSRFPGRFEDYQSHLLGGGWMGLPLAVPRVKKRRKRTLKGHFFFCRNERKRKTSSLWVLPRPAPPRLDSVLESALEGGKKVRMLPPGRAPVPPSNSPPAAGTRPK